MLSLKLAVLSVYKISVAVLLLTNNSIRLLKRGGTFHFIAPQPYYPPGNRSQAAL